MKQFVTMYALLLSTSLFGQASSETFVYGKINSSAPASNLSSYSGIMYKKYESAERWISSSISVDRNGYFQKRFPKNTKIDLGTYYKNFYTSDTTISTGSNDSLEINFTIHPKEYEFTEESAEADISRDFIRLIIFDSLIYNWNKEIHFTKKFGFDYYLLPRPNDYEFEDNINQYNSRVEKHLDTLQGDDSWGGKLYFIQDSLIHLEADNYGKTHNIVLKNLTFPTSVELPDLMEKRIRDQKADFDRLLKKKGQKDSDFTREFILQKIDSDSNYHFIFIAELWMAFNYQPMIPELVKRITDKKNVGLINTADLIIWERVKSGDLHFYGHGGVADDDLFTVAGRANHLLRRTTGQNFGSVSMYSTDADLKKLQNRWAYWIMTLGK